MERLKRNTLNFAQNFSAFGKHFLAFDETSLSSLALFKASYICQVYTWVGGFSGYRIYAVFVVIINVDEVGAETASQAVR
jgi:hypothetical protein